MANGRTRITHRCTGRKHVIENGQPACDCKAIILWPTAARNALVVTLPPGTLLPTDPELLAADMDVTGEDAFGV